MFVRKSTYDADIALEKARTERIASKWAKAMEDAETDSKRIKGLETALASAMVDALKYRRARANLIPGGPYRGKGSKPKPNGAAVQGASTAV